MSKITLRELIQDELDLVKETFDDIGFRTYKDEDLDVVHENQYGASAFKPFYAWSVRRVYFLCDYDGLNFVVSVPRYFNNTKFCEPVYAFGGHPVEPVLTTSQEVQVDANS